MRKRMVKCARKSKCVRACVDNSCRRISPALLCSSADGNSSMQRPGDLHSKPPSQPQNGKIGTERQPGSKYKVYIFQRYVPYLKDIFNFHPGWCGSVDWVLAWGPRGQQFNSYSGHMPGLWARSPVGGARETTTHWCFSPSLSPFLPPFPSLWKWVNKLFKKYKK